MKSTSFLHYRISDIQTRRCLLKMLLSFHMCYMLSCSVMSDSVTPWTVACQIPLCMEFSRQEYWSGLPFPSPGDLPDPGTEPASPALQVILNHWATWEADCIILCIYSAKQIWDVIQLKKQETKRNNQKNLKWDPNWKTMSILIFRTWNIYLFRTCFITINQ